ncbi:MAG: PKD domain-containing protein [Bacteroidales bacterium]|nr:PKD domain-containing protein [Bacteroidales bacterium]
MKEKKVTSLFLLLIFSILFIGCKKEDDKLSNVSQGQSGQTSSQDTTSQSTDTITIPQPEASFTSYLHASLTVDFQNTSIQSETYLWDFGDNSFSTQKSPTHTYNSKGNYTVTLTVQNQAGTASVSEKLNMTSSIKLISKSENPYYITIDGEDKGVIAGGSNYTFTNLTPGEHTVYVKQKSGYLLYATEETYQMSVNANSCYTRVFPDDSMGK